MRIRPGPASAFSLIELLVVVGIIVVLASMLLSAIPQVRTLAQATQCRSALRQVGMGIDAYCSEWSDCLPYVQTPDGTKWTTRVAEAMDVDSPNAAAQIKSRANILRGCPTYLNSAEYDPGTPAWPNTWDTGFGQNMYPLYGIAGMGSMTHYYWNGTWAQANGMTIARQRVSRKSTRALAADAPNYWSWPSSAILNGRDPRRRHRSSANCLFFDGHVSALDGKALIASHETP